MVGSVFFLNQEAGHRGSQISSFTDEERGLAVCKDWGLRLCGEQVSQNRLPEPSFPLIKPQVPALFCQADRVSALPPAVRPSEARPMPA